MFLLLCALVFHLEAHQKSLNSSYHVTENSYSKHLDEHLIHKFSPCISNYLTITHWRKTGYNPIKGGDVERSYIKMNSFQNNLRLDPADRWLLIKQLKTDQHPDAGTKVGQQY